MMQERILDQAEFERLKVNGLIPIHTDFFPGDIKAIVVEEDGEIVGTMMVARVVLLDSVWVRPDKKGNPGLIRRLLRKTQECAREWGQFAMAQTRHDKICDLLKRNGATSMEVKTFILPLWRVQ